MSNIIVENGNEYYVYQRPYYTKQGEKMREYKILRKTSNTKRGRVPNPNAMPKGITEDQINYIKSNMSLSVRQLSVDLKITEYSVRKAKKIIDSQQ